MRSYLVAFLDGTYIKEDCVSIGISIIPINAIEPLRELNIADLFPSLWVHQETHCLSHGLAVIYVMVTIQVQHEWSIGEHSRDTNLQVRITNKILHFILKFQFVSVAHRQG